MIEIRLYTAEGEFVATALVQQFRTPPKVLVWRERVFARSDRDGQYYEAFTYTVTHTKEGY